MLTRKVGQKIMIGEDTVLEVVRVSGRQVRLSVLAPKDVVIYRGEVVESGR